MSVCNNYAQSCHTVCFPVWDNESELSLQVSLLRRNGEIVLGVEPLQITFNWSNINKISDLSFIHPAAQSRDFMKVWTSLKHLDLPEEF